MSIPLDGCGTTLTQQNGFLSFNNTILGDDEALRIDGIIVSEKLGLRVACNFKDTFILDSDVGVVAAGHELGGHIASSNVRLYFSFFLHGLKKIFGTSLENLQSLKFQKFGWKKIGSRSIKIGNIHDYRFSTIFWII